MDNYRKILKEVREKCEKKDQLKTVEGIAETMCLSVDESPHMIAMEDGAAAVAAMYTLTTPGSTVSTPSATTIPTSSLC